MSGKVMEFHEIWQNRKVIIFTDQPVFMQEMSEDPEEQDNGPIVQTYMGYVVGYDELYYHINENDTDLNKVTASIPKRIITRIGVCPEDSDMEDLDTGNKKVYN